MTLSTRRTRRFLEWVLAFVLGFVAPMASWAQASSATRQSGTVKSAAADSFVLTTAAGQEVTVTLPAQAKVLIVAPGSHDLSSATPGSVTDIQPGDRALVTGSQGDTAANLSAARVILMKSTAIAQTHAAEEEAWTRGGGGIVKSVDPAGNKIVISSGLRTVTVETTPSTVIRRYAPGSVRFEDAIKSSIAAIQPGDQLRVRGTRSADGSSITADEIVTGNFKHYSGLLSAVDPSAGTVTLKDLATKKTVVVSVTPNTDIRNLPPQAAQMIAGRMRGTAAAPGGTHPAGAPGAARPGGSQEPEISSAEEARRAGVGLSQMLSRLPTEALSDLKSGDAVMIVATAPSDSSGHSSAVTLLNGVEPILTASPSGQTMTLSPWSVGSSGDAGAMGGEGGTGPGR